MNPSRFASGAVGGWVELGRNTGTTPSVTSLADKRYYMILSYGHPTAGSNNHGFRYNNDTAGNYAWRESTKGGADVTGGSSTYDLQYEDQATAIDFFGVSYLSNLSAKEKLRLGHIVGNDLAGAGTAPDRTESVGKWANTSSALNRIDALPTGGTWGTGAEIVVLGWDPADTHTDNFWEELASVELGSSGNLDSGTFTAKKYLWVQIFNKSVTTDPIVLTFNSDTGNNYARRFSNNGGADGTGASNPALYPYSTSDGTPKFMNMFIINNSANEKLVISNTIEQNTAGAGTAPARNEFAGKWANTSAQITKITNTGTLDVGSVIKVWGAN